MRACVLRRLRACREVVHVRDKSPACPCLDELRPAHQGVVARSARRGPPDEVRAVHLRLGNDWLLIG